MTASPTSTLRIRLSALALVVALSSCGGTSTEDAPYPSLYLTSTTMGPAGGVYEGPAVVERSTRGDLVLAFDGDPSKGSTLPRHLQVRNLGPTALPVGAKVWLKKDPAVPAYF